MLRINGRGDARDKSQAVERFTRGARARAPPPRARARARAPERLHHPAAGREHRDAAVLELASPIPRGVLSEPILARPAGSKTLLFVSGPIPIMSSSAIEVTVRSAARERADTVFAAGTNAEAVRSEAQRQRDLHSSGAAREVPWARSR